MGHELWASETHKYRRRGTRLAEVREVLNEITVERLYEPMEVCADNAPATEIASRLNSREFDVVGVKTNPIGPLLGFARQADLTQGSVSDHLEQIEASARIPPSTSLGTVIDKLSVHSFVVVDLKNHDAGIVTRADLNKPIARMYFFGFISLIEIHLGYWIRQVYPEGAWREKMSAGRLAAVETQHAEIGGELVDCLQFGDKKSLFIKSTVLRERFSIASKTAGQKVLQMAQGFRDDLAHAQNDLGRSSPWPERIAMLRQIEQWMEMSDQIIADEKT